MLPCSVFNKFHLQLQTEILLIHNTIFCYWYESLTNESFSQLKTRKMCTNVFVSYFRFLKEMNCVCLFFVSTFFFSWLVTVLLRYDHFAVRARFVLPRLSREKKNKNSLCDRVLSTLKRNWFNGLWIKRVKHNIKQN